MGEFFEKISRGLNEAIAYEQAERKAKKGKRNNPAKETLEDPAFSKEELGELTAQWKSQSSDLEEQEKSADED